MNKDLEKMALDLSKAAEELDLAKKHLLIASNHFKTAEVPRGCAHTFASQGHISKVSRIIRECSELHSTKAKV